MSICYSFYLIAGILACILLCVPSYLLFHCALHFIVIQLMCTILQILFCFLFFRIKRFQHGIPFLKKSYVANIGVYIGSMILIFSMVISTTHANGKKLKERIYLLFIPIIIILL